ncbi:sensor histidine kinase [Aeromicrobium sp. Root344]|uniref:sensor histidine kinase n=1 Tax=Aeromicrobium sp. Root344 TaxID=1736521 RepID=UPI000AB9EF6F|nr:ATP-binding protein [Aeromicrobium sp. Root344]
MPLWDADDMEQRGGVPASTSRLSPGRRRVGLIGSVAGPVVFTLAVLPWRGDADLGAVLPAYFLLVVVAAVLGGMGPGLLAAIASFLLANWFLTRPFDTLAVDRSDALAQLVVFVVVAVLVSLVVEAGARTRAVAARRVAETEVMSRLARSRVGSTSIEEVLTETMQLFELDGVVFTPPDGPVDAVSVGVRSGSEPTHLIETTAGSTLETWGTPSFADDLHLLRSLADASDRAWHEQLLEREASRAAALDEADRVRTALLAAVGHDLRTPLAVIKAAVTGLRSDEGSWADGDREDLLETADDSVDRLTSLIDNLLAMSRIEAGALLVRLEPVALVEVVSRVLIDRDDVTIEVPDDLPLAMADEALLERVLVNLVDNAVRHGGGVTEVVARVQADSVDVAVIDHGPGLPANRSSDPFTAQSGSDRVGTGAGLGLAIVGGLVRAMSGTVEATSTPGGGATVTVRLPVKAP